MSAVKSRRSTGGSTSATDSVTTDGVKSLHRYLNGYRGVLFKQGHVFKNWRERFFILENQRLRYYDNEKNMKLNGEYLISSSTEIYDIPDSTAAAEGRRNLFFISNQAMDEILYVSAATKEEKSAWIEAIYDATHRGFKMIQQLDLWPNGFYPSMELFASYTAEEGGAVENGNVLPIDIIETVPKVSFNYRSSSNDKYAMIMIDIDAIPSASDVGNHLIRQHCRLHWAIVDIEDDLATGTELTNYLSPAPVYNSGLHRYFFLLFRQKDGQSLSTVHLTESMERVMQRDYFNYKTWAEHMDFGDPVALNGFYAGWQPRCDELHVARGFVPPEAYRSPSQENEIKRKEEQEKVEENQKELRSELSLDKDLFPLKSAVQVPSIGLQVSYLGGVKAHDGCILTATGTHAAPSVNYQPHSMEDYYTLLMVDPDAPSRVNHSLREFIHWVVVNIPGNEVAKGTEVLPYLGPAPPYASGLHRYVFCLYKQQKQQKLPTKQIQEAMQFFNQRGGIIHSKWIQEQEQWLLSSPCGVEAFLCEWELACDGYHAAMDWMPPRAYRSPQQAALAAKTQPTEDTATADTNDTTLLSSNLVANSDDDQERLQKIKAAELLFRSKLKEAVSFHEMPTDASDANYSMSGSNSAVPTPKAPVGVRGFGQRDDLDFFDSTLSPPRPPIAEYSSSTPKATVDEDYEAQAAKEKLRLQQEHQEMLRAQQEKFMKEQMEQQAAQAEILRQQQEQFEAQKKLLEEQQEQLRKMSRSRSMEQDSFYGEVQLSGSDEVLRALPGSPRSRREEPGPLQRKFSGSFDRGITPQGQRSRESPRSSMKGANYSSRSGSPVGSIGSKKISFRDDEADLYGKSISGSGSISRRHQRDVDGELGMPPRGSSASGSVQDMRSSNVSAGGGGLQRKPSDLSTSSSKKNAIQRSPSMAGASMQQMNPEVHNMAYSTPVKSQVQDDEQSRSSTITTNSGMPMLGSQPRAVSAMTPGSSNTSTAKLARKLSSAAVDRKGSSSRMVAGDDAATSGDIRERVARATNTRELCEIFGITSTSIFQGETMKKKYSKDFMAKDSLIWIDARTKSLHWAKTKGDAKNSKYLRLDRFSSESDAKPLGDMKGIIKKIEANGANLMIYIESGESLELKLSADGFPPAAKRATDWVRVIRAFDAP